MSLKLDPGRSRTSHMSPKLDIPRYTSTPGRSRVGHMSLKLDPGRSNMGRRPLKLKQFPPTRSITSSDLQGITDPDTPGLFLLKIG